MKKEEVDLDSKKERKTKRYKSGNKKRDRGRRQKGGLEWRRRGMLWMGIGRGGRKEEVAWREKTGAL